VQKGVCGEPTGPCARRGRFAIKTGRGNVRPPSFPILCPAFACLFPFPADLARSLQYLLRAHTKLIQPQPTSRSFIMLNIKDLAAAHTLDARQMAAVSGGFNANLSQIGDFNQAGVLGGKGSPNTQVGIFAPVVTQSNLDVDVDASSHTTGYGTRYPKWM